MVDFDTPQLNVVKRLLDAYNSLDMNNVEPLLSRNYEYEALPESADFPKQTKESHLQAWGRMFSSPNKFGVTVHEATEAPGEVAIHFTGVLSTISGAKLSCDTFMNYTLVEEDGELKILHCTDTSDPEQRSAFISGALKAAAEEVTV